MNQDETSDAPQAAGAERAGADRARKSKTQVTPMLLAMVLLTLGIGLSMGYLLWGEGMGVASALSATQSGTHAAAHAEHASAATEEAQGAELPGTWPAPQARPTQGPALPPAQYIAHLPDSYTLPVRYGDLGPQLLAAGAIDLPAFLAIYTDGGKPLSADQEAILTAGSSTSIVIDHDNAHFLLNFFWAVGLANRNDILLTGPIQDKGPDTVGEYAATGGWTLAARPVMDVFASLPLIELTDEQQRRLQTVAEGVYRPCCGNNTAFPDCNHGMAMLGILELLAANDASEDDMFEAAKYINAFWFPREMTQAAAYFKLTQGQEFADVDAQRMVSKEIFSMSGARAVQQWLAEGGRLGEPVEGGGACGV
jgi:hypothetical protein